jgi:hypothetical protein
MMGDLCQCERLTPLFPKFDLGKRLFSKLHFVPLVSYFPRPAGRLVSQFRAAIRSGQAPAHALCRAAGYKVVK